MFGFQGTTEGWPATTVRDTVVAITQDREYDRATTQSVWEYLSEAIGRALRAFFDLFPQVRSTRFLVVALAALLAVLLIARIVLQARARREFWAGERRDSRRGRAVDPWMEAERHAAAGSYLEAAHHLCAASLAASARRGDVTLHPAKTTGDYAREMRRRGAPAERAFQVFRARYDRVVYDLQSCSAEEYGRLLQDARPLLDLLERAA